MGENLPSRLHQIEEAETSLKDLLKVKARRDALVSSVVTDEKEMIAATRRFLFAVVSGGCALEEGVPGFDGEPHVHGDYCHEAKLSERLTAARILLGEEINIPLKADPTFVAIIKGGLEDGSD